MSDILPPGLESFNGYRKHHCVLIPVSLISVPAKQLSWLDKVVYGQLRFEAGNSDRCRVVLAIMASKFNVSEDSMARSIERLVQAGLIFRKRLRNESLIVFLQSPLLDGSAPKFTLPDSATLRSLESATLRSVESGSDSAELRSVSGSDSATLRVETPQPCGPDSATLRSAYKEYSGFSLGLKKEQCSSSSFSSESKSSAADEQNSAAAAAPFSQSEKPQKPADLTPEDRRSIAEACCAVISGIPLAAESEFLDKIWALAQEHGCPSAAVLVSFISGLRRRNSWQSHGIWLRVIPGDLPEFLAAEAAKPVACERCSGAGTVGDVPCTCPAGAPILALRTRLYSIGAVCRECLSNLKTQTQADQDAGRCPSCAFCYPPVDGQIVLSQEVHDRLHKFQALSRSDNPHEAALAADRFEKLLGEHGASETTMQVAVRLEAALPAEQCNLCLDPHTGKSTGIRRTDWNTTTAKAAFCNCRWAELERQTQQADYPETIALAEREWVVFCQEFDNRQHTKAAVEPKPIRPKVNAQPVVTPLTEAQMKECLDRIRAGEAEEKVMREIRSTSEAA